MHKMLIPKKPVCITEKELAGYVFEEGEDTREAGERLAASYVNFYIGNKVVLVPQFGDEHDVLATDLLPLHHAADTSTWLTDFLFSHTLFQRCDNRVSETSLILKNEESEIAQL